MILYSQSRTERNGSVGGGGSGSSTRRSTEKHQEPGGGSNATGTGTQTSSTSPVASPRPHRRHHHHHHHHNHQCGSSSGSSTKHGHPPQSDEDVAAPEPLAQQLSAQQQQQRKARRGTHGGWYSRHGKSQDSGRSSDSSTLSLSVGSTKRSDKLGSVGSGQAGSLTSPLRATPTTGRRTLDPPPLEFGIGSTASTPLSSRKKGSLELSRQRSLDSETGPVGSAGLLMGPSSTTPTPVRSKPNDLFYRDGSLSRSLSFMQQRRPQTVIYFLSDHQDRARASDARRLAYFSRPVVN